MAHEIPDPQKFEDSAVRFATPGEENNRNLPRKLVKGTYVLTDGPNSGQTVEYVAEEAAAVAGGGLTDAQLRATPVPTNDVGIADTVGQKARAASAAVTLSTEDQATQDSLKTALEIIDDWDEADRAKVNPIVGQAGVQGGAGAVSATTQRVALATDANVVKQIAKRLTDPGDGTTSLEVKYAKGVQSTDTADFIAPVAGKKILVVEAVVQKQADNTNLVIMKFNNSVANTIIAGAPEVTMKNCGDGVVLPFSLGGWFVTSADGEGVDLDITAAENVMVQLGYIEID